jgi:hypothetical protein
LHAWSSTVRARKHTALKVTEILTTSMIMAGTFGPVDEDGVTVKINLGVVEITAREEGTLKAWYLKAKAEGLFRPQFA